MGKLRSYSVLVATLLPIFFVISLFLASSAEAVSNGLYGLKPARPRADNSKSESIFIHTINPGQTIEEAVSVFNNSDRQETYVLYAADFTPSTDGGFACKQFVEPREEVGAWINLPPTTITLPKGGSKEVEFTITAPQNVDPGEYNGCILVARQEPEKIKQGDSGITLSFRTGARVALTVPGEIIRNLSLQDFDITQENWKKYSQLSIKNDGNVSVDTNIQVTVKNLLGQTFHKNGGVFSVLKKDTATFHLEIGRSFWGGIYFANLEGQYNKGTISSDPQTQFFSAGPVMFFAFPSLKGFLLELLFLGFIVWTLFLMLFKKRQNFWIKKTWKKAKINASTNLSSVARAVGASPSLVAKINNLPVATRLKKGDLIYVPGLKSASKSKTKKHESANPKRTSANRKSKGLFTRMKKKVEDFADNLLEE